MNFRMTYVKWYNFINFLVVWNFACYLTNCLFNINGKKQSKTKTIFVLFDVELSRLILLFLSVYDNYPRSDPLGWRGEVINSRNQKFFLLIRFVNHPRGFWNWRKSYEGSLRFYTYLIEFFSNFSRHFQKSLRGRV